MMPAERTVIETTVTDGLEVERRARRRVPAKVYRAVLQPRKRQASG